MKKTFYRSILLQVGLLCVIFLVIWTPEKLSPSYNGLLSSLYLHQDSTLLESPSPPMPVRKKSTNTPSPKAKPSSTPSSSLIDMPFSPIGASVWILSCLDGWQTQKIYQTNPYYINAQGVKKARDVYVFGNFWLQPNNGTLLTYSDASQTPVCLSNLITTVHTQYHAHVCAVLGVQESSNGWKGSDVTAYTKRAVTQPTLLAPIFQQVKKNAYDCLINDIEDGDAAHPEVFTRYEALLHRGLSIPLGQTLVWKTPEVSSYWQTWEDWGSLANEADFFIVMALDHDSLYAHPIPTSIVDYTWLQDVYSYMRSVPSLFGRHPVTWELPTYYRQFMQQSDSSWSVSSGTDVQSQIAIALKTIVIQKNAMQDSHDPYIKYLYAPDTTAYLFFETATSSDALARSLTQRNGTATCLQLSFWDNDSGTSNSLGWSAIDHDENIHLC